MSVRRKLLVVVLCLVSTILAGFLSDILKPVIANAGFAGVTEFKGSGHFTPLTLLGQLRMSLDDYFWLRTDDYLHFGITHGSYTKMKMEQSMIEEFNVKVLGSAKHRNVAASATPRERDWRGVFKYFEFFDEIKGQHGDPAELLPWYRVQTIINPLDTAAYANGAFFLSDFAKKPEEALTFLEEGIRNNPDSPELQEATGQLYFEKWKDYDKAIPYLEKAIAAGKGIRDRDVTQEKVLGDAYIFLVRAYREKGNRDAALRTAEEGVTECPNNALVRAAYRLVKKDMKG